MVNKNKDSEEKKYTEKDFLLAHKDNQGHTAPAGCRVPPGWVRQTDIIRASGKFPFKTNSDIYRWCIDRGVKELMAIEDTIPSLISQLDFMGNLVVDSQMKRAFDKGVYELYNEVQEYLKMGDEEGAKQLVKDSWEAAKEAPDSRWKTSTMRGIRMQLGHLLPSKSVSAVDLVDEDEDED